MLFESLMSVKEAQKKMLEKIREFGEGDAEVLNLESAHLRVLAEDLRSQIDIPHYNRAAMDGFAVRSEEVKQAGRTNPVMLEKGKNALWVHTGDSVPDGFDAVVKLEDTEEVEDYVLVYKAVRKYENVGLKGEDVKAGEILAERGTLLRAHHLALFRSAGIESVKVFRKPKILVVPTGDELVKPGEKLLPGKVYESNGIMVSSYLKEWGADVHTAEIISDDENAIERVFENIQNYDMVVTTGGTSVGKRDLIYRILDRMGDVVFRGIALRPGKPTIFAIVDGVPVLALPGFPAACVASAYLFLKPAVRKMLSMGDEPTFHVELAESVYSKAGFTSFVRLRVDFDKMIAYPLSSYGSGILSSVARANAYTIIDENVETVEKGEIVKAFLL